MKNQRNWKWSMPLFFGVLFSLSSCQKEVPHIDLDTADAEQHNVYNYDFSAYVGDPRAEACRVVTLDDEDEITNPRAAALTAKRWPRGRVVRVSFIGGTNYVRQRVMFYAKQWEQYANITFQFVASGGEVRVAFMQGAGSYSYLGTDALRIPANRETMNFGWFNNNTSETEFSRTTIHEFGHALGLIHEHQHPNVQLNWDREFVYNYYAGAPNYWTRQQVDINLLNRYSAAETTFNAYDELSIMHYPILGRMINRPNSTPNNWQLSNGDKHLAGVLYPF